MLIIAEKGHNRKQNDAGEGDKEHNGSVVAIDAESARIAAMTPSMPVIMRIPP